MRPSESIFINKTRELGRDRSGEFGSRAYDLCKGVGLEIGAVNCPFDVDAEVFYLDQVSEVVLKERFKDDPNIDELIPLTFIAPTMPYVFLADNSFDFAIASHVLEHVPNVGLAIEELMRIVRPGGIVYVVVPHKEFCFDRDRWTTPFQHLAIEYLAAVQKISYYHYLEVEFQNTEIHSLDKRSAGPIVERSQTYFDKQLDFHVHTFTEISFFQFCSWLAPLIGATVKMEYNRELHIHVAFQKNKSS